MRIDVAVRNLEQLKAEKLTKVDRQYRLLCAGIHPDTGDRMWIDCITTAGTFRMDAGENAAAKMLLGVQLTERLGRSEMDKIRDFYNADHLNIPLTVASQIMLQQGALANEHWKRKGQLVDAVNAATTKAEVRAIVVSFFM